MVREKGEREGKIREKGERGGSERELVSAAHFKCSLSSPVFSSLQRSKTSDRVALGECFASTHFLHHLHHLLS